VDRQEFPILVVDDDQTILRLLVLTLRDAGFEVISAHDGAEALELATRRRISMVVLDLEMPVMDGASFYRALRRSGSRTPVMVLSAHGAARAARELGAESWMEKPYDEGQFIAQVRDLADGGRSELESRCPTSLSHVSRPLGREAFSGGVATGLLRHRQRKLDAPSVTGSHPVERRGQTEVA